MNSLTIEPISEVNGTINLPGSKSVSNRALLMAALAQGETTFTNLLDADDVSHMLKAFQLLGIEYQISDDKKTCTVKGNAGAFESSSQKSLFLGNAGTAMRPLCAVLAFCQGEFELTGEPRMFERPIGHLVDALKQMGADISYLKDEGFPPLLIQGKPLSGGVVEIDCSVSSQFLTALLIASPLATSDLKIVVKDTLVSKPYVDITMAMMSDFGVSVENNNYKEFTVKGNQQYKSPGDYLIEGDASSASYFLAAAAIKGGKVRVTGIGKNSMQGDIKFADALAAMGAKVTFEDSYVEVERGDLNPIDMDMNHIPDAAMTIATTALFAKSGKTVLRNIYNWRVKETDRLAAMAAELRKVGAEVEEGEDYIVIQPPETLTHAAIDTYNDHRMAMCFSLVALSETPVTINDPGCTSKTFPDYFEQLEKISKR